MKCFIVTAILGFFLWSGCSQGSELIEQSTNQTASSVMVMGETFSDVVPAAFKIVAAVLYYGIIGVGGALLFFGLSLISSGLVAGYLYCHRPWLPFAAPVAAAPMPFNIPFQPPFKFLTDAGG